jgi:hypothetical protein
MKYAYKVLLENLKGRLHFVELGGERRISS